MPLALAAWPLEALLVLDGLVVVLEGGGEGDGEITATITEMSKRRDQTRSASENIDKPSCFPPLKDLPASLARRANGISISSSAWSTCSSEVTKEIVGEEEEEDA